MIKSLSSLSFCFLLLLLSFNTKAEIVVTDSTDRIMVGKQLSVLHADKELSFRQVLNSDAFKPNNSEVPNLGISPVSTWLKFTITNKTDNARLLLNVAYPILDEVELFVPDSNSNYSGSLMGEIKKFDTRQYKHPDYIFDINVPQNSSKTFYLRIKSAEQLIIPISVNRPDTLWQVLTTENLLSGIYWGAVLIMFLYNLFVYFSVRDKSYIYYVIYVASVGLTQLGIKGYTFQYLFGNYPDFEQKSIVIFASIGGIAALMFTKSFVLTAQKAPKSDKVLSVIIVFLWISIGLTLLGRIQTGFQVMQVSTTAFSIAIIAVSAIVMGKGYAPAKFVFVAWSIFFIGAIIFALKDYGILPFNNYTSYTMQAASAIEMALLSFGLADRINILKKEKEASQAEALRIATENERIIREQNVVLEAKVNERTFELKEANTELYKTLDDLKQTQTQLVESEKMASLGQLTAGIAHEINNPINFVTSNVSPLQRDVDILFDALEAIEETGMSEASAADKQKKIDEYKEEIDLDYLKIEISHLLKGIREGAGRTAEIVKGLRVFSRLDEDDLKLADINDCLESTMVIANNLLQDNIKVVKDLDELPLVECYPGKLNQVFLNVISNAIHAISKKHNGAAGGELKISTRKEDDNVFISISDNGIGMDENTTKKIFEPFFTTKEVGEGTGLGMSIAYNTIKKHNGVIHINTEPGQGTEFVIELPVQHKITATV